MHLKTLRTKLWMLLLLMISFFSADASHILGGELYYTYVSGNTYTINLIIYGDCAGSAQAFAGLSNATPAVQIFNNGTLVTTVNLQPLAGSGINVSPVCPDEINNTTCTMGGTLPGVKKFMYAYTYNLGGTSISWKFRTTGDMGNSTQAGRSNAITNAVIGVGGSLMSLEATLNNTVTSNSSPTYTTIPTPFFCINKPQQYNQGAVDPNADSLTFALVPGLVSAGTGTASSNVVYVAPYTATAPLGCSPGTFLFSNTTGQLNFTPNIIQDALIVSSVSEYRNGVLVGTSMREMTFIVLNNCTNNPPTGNITNPVNGTLENSTTFKVCSFAGTVSFSINSFDVDSDNVTIATQGIPTGAVVNITGNGTTTPTFSFSWNITNVTPGTYVFYLTFSDDGCPLASKQSIAYTVKVIPKPGILFNLISPATCTKKAKFSITPVGLDTPYVLHVNQGATPVLTINNIYGMVTDSVAGGVYGFTLTGAGLCSRDTVIDLSYVVQLSSQVAFSNPVCPGSSTGTVTLTGTGNHPPFTYAIGSGTYSSTNVFGNLSAGTYVLHLKDSAGCVKDTSVTLVNPIGMALTLGIKKPVCMPINNGQISVTVANGTAPYQYALNTGTFGTSNSFTGLAPGTHVLHIKDANSCLKDTTITLIDSMQMLVQPNISPILCFGNTNGVITLNVSGTTAPYNYTLGTGTATTNNVFSNLGQGTYTFHISDQNGCLKDTSIVLVQPYLLGFTSAVTQVLCFGNNTGSVIVNAFGGTPVYQYAVDANAFQASNVLLGLSSGAHIIHLKDANNCTKDTTINITQPATAVTFGTFSIVAPTCEGFTDGSVHVAAQGGVSPYQFSFDNSAFVNNTTFNQISEGTYVVKAKDNNGCTIDTSITFTGYPHIILNGVNMQLPTCNGKSDGQLTLNVSGGNPPYTYQIDGSGGWSSSPVFSNKASGSYTLSVKDNNGCKKDTTVFLLQPDKMLIDTSAVGNDCNGVDNGGVITISVIGGTAPFQYNWQHDANLHTPKITGLINGVYTVDVIDAKGCTASASVHILYNNCCTPFIPNAFSPNGDGNNDRYKVEYKGDMNLKEMYIYNRYGQRVFSSSNVDKAWDGTYNGKAADAGTYFYYIRILCGNILQKELIFKGDVTLVR